MITDERVIYSGGILRSDTSDVRIENIQQLTTGQSLIESLLGSGNISITTGGGTGLKLNGIKDHESAANSIRTLQSET